MPFIITFFQGDHIHEGGRGHRPRISIQQLLKSRFQLQNTAVVQLILQLTKLYYTTLPYVILHFELTFGCAGWRMGSVSLSQKNIKKWNHYKYSRYFPIQHSLDYSCWNNSALPPIYLMPVNKNKIRVLPFLFIQWLINLYFFSKNYCKWVVFLSLEYCKRYNNIKKTFFNSNIS